MTFANDLELWLDAHEDARWPRRDELLAWAAGFDALGAAWSACERGSDLVALAGRGGARPEIVVAATGRLVRPLLARLTGPREPRLAQGVHAAETAAEPRSTSARARLLDHAQTLLAIASKAEVQRVALEAARKKGASEAGDARAELDKAAFAAVARAAAFCALATAVAQRDGGAILHAAYALEDAARACAALDQSSAEPLDLDAAATRAAAVHAASLRAELGPPT
jgi:hypothetical protein